MKNGHKTIKKSLIFFILSINALIIISCSSVSTPNVYTTSRSHHTKIVRIAKSQLGAPYRYGGVNPKTGFDCSGLINYSYKKAGLSIPRTTKQLYHLAKPIKRNQLKVGDLVFFRINRKKISHVGLYLGNSKFIHAPSGGKKVNIANMNDKYWRVRFTRGGRL